MPQPVKNDEIQSRLHEYARSNYLFLGNVTKGVVLAIATQVLLQIVGDFRAEWVRLMPWLASFFGIVVTYVTWDIGTLLSNARTNTLDSVLPLSMGVAEFLLFGILWKIDQSKLWLNWLLCSGTHSLIGGLIAHNRIRITDFHADFVDPKMSKIYEAWLLRCKGGAFFLAGATYILWLGQKWVEAGKIFQFVCGIPISLLLIKIILDTTTMKRRVDEHAMMKESKAAGA